MPKTYTCKSKLIYNYNSNVYNEKVLKDLIYPFLEWLLIFNTFKLSECFLFLFWEQEYEGQNTLNTIWHTAANESILCVPV